MWSYNQEDINKDLGSEYLEKSGCFKAKILFAKKKNSSSSQSEGLEFNVETESGSCRFDIWYKNKTGEEISFSTAMLNQLCFMLKIDPSKFETYTKTEKFGDNEYQNEFIKNFEGKEVGVFLMHKYDTYNGKTSLKFDCKGFYYPETNKTTSETKKGEEAKKFEYWTDKFKDNNLAVKKPEKEKVPADDFFGGDNVEDSDEFPF